MTKETKPEQQTCTACGAIFIGDNFHNIKYVNVSNGPVIPIERFKLQTCNKNSNPQCLTRSLVNRTVFTKRRSYNAGFLTPSQHDDIAVQLIKEMGLTMPDRYITIKWIEGARRSPWPIDTPYHPTTYIKGVEHMLSVIIEFNDSTNEGYLRFLRPEFISDVDLSGMEIDLYEGNRITAKAKFK